MGIKLHQNDDFRTHISPMLYVICYLNKFKFKEISIKEKSLFRFLESRLLLSSWLLMRWERTDRIDGQRTQITTTLWESRLVEVLKIRKRSVWIYCLRTQNGFLAFCDNLCIFWKITAWSAFICVFKKFLRNLIAAWLLSLAEASLF